MIEKDYMAGMQRDDPAVSSSELIDAFERGADEYLAALDGLSPEEIRTRPVPGRWSPIELVAHVTDTEVYFCERILRTLAENRPLLMSVDESPYPERLGYPDLDLADEMAVFSALRRRVGRVLRGQPAEAWHRKGVHSASGVVSVRQLVFQAIRHARHHLRFLDEKREALGHPPRAGRPAGDRAL